MRTADIEREVRGFVAENYIVDGDLDADTSLTRTGVIDSMGVLELIMFLEARYGFTIPDEDALPEHLDTVDRIVAYVSRRVEEAAGGQKRVA